MGIDGAVRICAVAVLIVGSTFISGVTAAHTVHIEAIPGGSPRVVSVGSWYKFSDGLGWTFRPETYIYHLELALYDATESLIPGATPFSEYQSRSSGGWPDGPENESGELGYEVSPNVLGDNNTHLYGKAYYRSLRLFGGYLSPDSVYQVTIQEPAPPHLWIHPVFPNSFTMSTGVLQSPEGTLQNPAYGPASVNRTIVSPDSTRFEYTGLLPLSATGLKDDYPVRSYGQRPGSHGSGDFGWFPGYALSFRNEGPGEVLVALFVTTGFTGPSGAPSNTLANDTFWKSNEVFLAADQSTVVVLDFDSVTGHNLVDNPFPHTAGDQTASEGTSGVAVNIFDRLQVSAIGWEVRSGIETAVDADLLVLPVESAPYGPAVGSVVIPTAGDAWDIGSIHSVVWVAGTLVENRTIQISRDEGPWTDIALGIPNTGDFQWVVTEPASNNAIVRVFPSGAPERACSSDAFSIIDPASSVRADDSSMGIAPRFTDIAPNPFNTSTRIGFFLPRVAHVMIQIYDVRGRVIKTLESGPITRGRHSTFWDARDEAGEEVASGIYFVRLMSSGQVVTRKTVVVR